MLNYKFKALLGSACLLFTIVALNAQTPQYSSSTTTNTVSLIDVGINKPYNFAYNVKAGKLAKSKETPSLEGKPLTNAFGTVGNCIFSYDLKGKGERLTGRIGIDDSVDKNLAEAVEVEVYGDNKRLWSSGAMKPGDAPIAVDVDIKGVKRLELIQNFADDHYLSVQLVWDRMAISYTGDRPLAIWPQPTPYDGKSLIIPPNPETPRITGAPVFGVRPGSPFLFTVTASGRHPMTFAAKDLPQGLKLDPATGIITGTLSEKGEYRVLLSARNELGSAERVLRIVVGDKISLTPVMGWSSWNAFLKEIDQQKIDKTAELMVSLGLKDHGYIYVNIDDGWQGKRGGPENALQPNEKFPDMKGLADKIHQLGLKFGIYHTAWMATYGRLCGGTAATPDGKWDPEHPVFEVGPYSFLEQDCRQFAKWGADFLKCDWLLNHGPKIDAPVLMSVLSAIKKSGRDIVSCITNRINIELGPMLAEHAECWDPHSDLLSHWTFLANIAFSGDQWAQYTGPGHWPYKDMLVAGVCWGKKTELTPDEQCLELSMWSLMCSPLVISCDLEKMDDFTLRLLTNDEVLDIDQDPLGKPARRKWRQGHLEAWVRDLEDGSKAIGFFNRSREPEKATIGLKDLGLEGKYQARDLWKRTDIGTVEQTITVAPRPHGVVLLRLWPVDKSKK